MPLVVRDYSSKAHLESDKNELQLADWKKNEFLFHCMDGVDPKKKPPEKYS